MQRMSSYHHGIVHSTITMKQQTYDILISLWYCTQHCYHEAANTTASCTPHDVSNVAADTFTSYHAHPAVGQNVVVGTCSTNTINKAN